MIIRRTRMVSFPRSGHHWLVDLLRAALGSEFRYSRYYIDGQPEETWKSLENSPEINAQKCHDFDGKVPLDPDFVHIVQTRAFAPAAISRWKLDQTKAEIWKQEDPETFLAWMDQVARYYKRWTAKWIDGPAPNRMVIPYDLLHRRPAYVLWNVLGLMTDLDSRAAHEVAYDAVLHHPPRWDAALGHKPISY